MWLPDWRMWRKASSAFSFQKRNSSEITLMVINSVVTGNPKVLVHIIHIFISSSHGKWFSFWEAQTNSWRKRWGHLQYIGSIFLWNALWAPDCQQSSWGCVVYWLWDVPLICLSGLFPGRARKSWSWNVVWNLALWFVRFSPDWQTSCRIPSFVLLKYFKQLILNIYMII